MKKFIKINLIILVIFCLLSSLILQPILAVEDEELVEEYDETNSDEEDLEESSEEEVVEEEQEEKTLDDLQIEKNEIKEEINVSSEQIQFIEEDLTKTVAEISEINQKILDKQMEVDTLKAQEKDLILYIDKVEYEIEKSDKRYKKQKDILEQRLVAMYELGEVSYLDLLLSSRSISEIFSNYYLITEISKADEELLEYVSSEKRYNARLKEVLDEKKEKLSNSRETREKNSIALENMSKIKNIKLSTLNEEQAEIQRKIEEYQNEIAEIETEIRLLAIANVGKDYVGGVMAWPVPGYTRITSPFGMRTHPITGIYKLHTGTDIGAPMGAEFVAANDGIVTYAGWNRAYGNMVIIDHGGGITTLYAHGSEILTEVGTKIFQGTPILKVGSTGYSTGPHAHFEVRINGQYVDPLQFITSYNKPNKPSKDKMEDLENEVIDEKDKNNNYDDEEDIQEE